MYVAMRTVPGVESTAWTAFTATWVSAMVGTLISWATTAGTDDGLITSLTRRARRQVTVADPDVDGVLFVQLDGVPFPVLQWARAVGRAADTAAAGCRPASHELRSGRRSCRARRRPARWASCTARSTASRRSAGTTASSGRVLVANRPADAAIIEERASDGRGLLADGRGVGIATCSPVTPDGRC